MLISKKQALGICLTLLKGEKMREDYGSSVLFESRKILTDMLGALEVEEEVLAKSLEDSKRVEKKKVETQAAKNLASDWESKTILDLEKKD